MNTSGLLDLEMLSTKMISGLETDEIEEIVAVQDIIRDSPCDILSDFLPQTSKADKDLPPEVENDLIELESSAIPKSTRYQQNKWLAEFTNFLVTKEMNSDLKSVSKQYLANSLRYFYSELKTKQNCYYSPSSLNCIRAALYRWFIAEPFGFNIIKDTEFYHANAILKAMARKYLENGGTKKHFHMIEKKDMEKLNMYFDRSSPDILQEEIYFSIEYYLGLRGREWIKGLKRNQIQIETDSRNRKYVTIEGIDSIQKNDQPKIDASHSSQSVKEGRLYSFDIPERCPVRAFELFLEKLPDDCDRLFFKSNRNWVNTSKWYNSKLPMGVNTIGGLMKRISMSAGLSKVYTSHCIRPTVVTNMFNQGMRVEDIQNITGHKNKDSVKRYLKHVSDDKKSKYSAALSNGFVPHQDNNLPTSSEDGQCVNHCQIADNACKLKMWIFLNTHMQCIK